jgi:hypothetical protein
VDNEVNLRYNDKDGVWDDQDNPDVAWQITAYTDDSRDCIVCDFPIDPDTDGEFHFFCSDSGDDAHRWCVGTNQDDRATSRKLIKELKDGQELDQTCNCSNPHCQV